MKSVMYHYVRKAQPDVPFFTYLDADSFTRQIDYFLKNFNVLDKDAFERVLETGKPVPGSIVLTFDDGLSDHFDHVRPILIERGLWGIFYVSTKPYVDKRLLDVHRTHYLLGNVGGKYLLECVEARIEGSMFVQERMAALDGKTYTKQNNSPAVTQVKKLLNYFLRPEWKSKVLDSIMSEIVGDESALAERFYLTESQLNQMIDDGLAVGSHSHSHTLLSNLSPEEQKQEISMSTKILQKMTGGRLFPSFCFPYGGRQSYSSHTLSEISSDFYKSGFSVESRDIDNLDITNRPYELPRYDCNEFLHGTAVIGEA
ncbi:delta-lactam-biosynthetic de-N-acetylase [Bordetella trematum]|uniref:polysaccharide deacetylase family protein n=1 Tax=Bordetella trematum TaxID=123899 RepID=UPI000795B538|nr:polysaccharide deacetylase family protein [Bordetella trematum]SAI28503.1 delta-lactam-biosynthetic de-N-acetylase [Bordetella trematum]